MGVFNSPALDSVIATVAAISDREPEDGAPSYCGHDLQELAESSRYETVVFLLLNGRLPEEDEFERFRADFANNRELPESLIDALRPVAHKAHPLDLLRTAVDFLGMVDPEAHDVSRAALYRCSIRTIAKLPTVIAASHRLARRLEPIGPIRRLTHAQNFFYMLSGYGPDEDAAIALDKMLILHAEHESDLACLAARMMASSSMDYYSAIAASIGSLKGRLQRGTHEHAMPMLRCIGELDRAPVACDAFAGSRRVTGFGRGTYRTSGS
jgi:2-methylcitrate synthase